MSALAPVIPYVDQFLTKCAAEAPSVASRLGWSMAKAAFERTYELHTALGEGFPSLSPRQKLAQSLEIIKSVHAKMADDKKMLKLALGLADLTPMTGGLGGAALGGLLGAGYGAMTADEKDKNKALRYGLMGAGLGGVAGGLGGMLNQASGAESSGPGEMVGPPELAGPPKSLMNPGAKYGPQIDAAVNAAGAGAKKVQQMAVDGAKKKLPAVASAASEKMKPVAAKATEAAGAVGNIGSGDPKIQASGLAQLRQLKDQLLGGLSQAQADKATQQALAQQQQNEIIKSLDTYRQQQDFGSVVNPALNQLRQLLLQAQKQKDLGGSGALPPLLQPGQGKVVSN